MMAPHARHWSPGWLVLSMPSWSDQATQHHAVHLNELLPTCLICLSGAWWTVVDPEWYVWPCTHTGCCSEQVRQALTRCTSIGLYRDTA
jgi:hypothetical protein